MAKYSIRFTDPSDNRVTSPIVYQSKHAANKRLKKMLENDKYSNPRLVKV